MTPAPLPPVDSRSSADLERQVRAVLAASVPGWTDDAPHTGAAAALLRVLARFGELIIERVNRAPARNRLAFLRHLGAAPRPAEPARAPVTFVLAAGARADVTVPAGTQVSTAGGDPVVFETAQALGVTAARLARVAVKDPLRDRYTDAAALLGDAPAAVAPFTGMEAIPHAGWIGHPDYFGARALDELAITFDVDDAAGASGTPLAWSLWDGRTNVAVVPTDDTTNALTRSGVVRFARLPAFAAATVHGVTGRWLRVQAVERVAAPVIVRSVTMERSIGRSGLAADAAVATDVIADLTRDVRPFGDDPQVGDVFYVAQREAFSLPLATVTLTFTGSEDTSGAAQTSPARQTLVAWETWDGEAWAALGTSRSTEDVLNDANGFSDTTRALRRSGTVTFRLPATLGERTVLGAASYWVRARILSRGVVEPGGAVMSGAPAPPGTPAEPPAVQSLAIGYALSGPMTTARPETILADNDFTLADGTRDVRELGSSIALLQPVAGRRAALYFGIAPPEGWRLPLAPLSIYVGLESAGQQVSTGRPAPKEPVLVWEYARGDGAAAPGATTWERLTVRDGTHGLTRSGIVDVLLPRDIVQTEEFGTRALWLRLVRRAPVDERVPSLRFVRLNTVVAVQSVTFHDEVLGSSTGTPHQTFRISRPGLLAGASLDVMELDSGGEEWVPWTEVADFNASGPLDRHHLLDHAEGIVTFGDGVRGRVPPAGTANVRLASYRTGGGVRGNVPAGSLVQLKTTIPYVERVTNPEAATGGADPEAIDDFGRRAPLVLRHQHRAVTAEDYEDLARLASGEVARTQCLPMFDVRVPGPNPGAVSLVIVPRSNDPRPRPAPALLDHVHAFVAARQAPSVQLVVAGPEFLAIDVDADVVVSAFDRITELDADIGRRVTAFLDPLRGGPAGTGWAFGRQPHRSDLFSVIGSVPGVNHVRAVRLSCREDRPGLLGTSRFLVCGGTVRMWFFGEQEARA